MKEKEIPLLDSFFSDTPFLTAEKCVKPDKKKIYINKVVAFNVSTAVLCWEDGHEGVPEIVKHCELIVNDVAWDSYLWNKKVLFVRLRIGSPNAAACIEELKIFGIKNFIAAGTAGCIDKDFDINKVIVINRAIRDEGTSYHYLPASLYVDLDKNIANKISRFLADKGVQVVQGTTWTTDAFYRETKERIKKRISQGALAVEMECAALAATAQFYGINFGQFIWFSDMVESGDWSWISTHENRKTLKEKFLLLALEFAQTL